MVFQTPPSLVVYEGKRFLISDAPSDSNLHEYLRVCVDTYGRNLAIVAR